VVVVIFAAESVLQGQIWLRAEWFVSLWGYWPHGAASGSAQRRWKWSFLWADGCSAAQGVEGVSVDVFPWVAGAEPEQHAAHADPYDGADFEQLQADRIHLRLCQCGVFQPQPESWSCARRVVAKAEYLDKGENPRFVVTSLTAEQWAAQDLYEKLYCARGEMENRIKEQMCLFADRLSTDEMKGNQLRLYFSALAYTLNCAAIHCWDCSAASGNWMSRWPARAR
jgi:hypothetical protein